jgi:ATP adenylyltransferase
MDRLWAPWRLAYVTASKPSEGCVFCDASAREERDALMLFEGRACYVILNLYPYNNGHVMVVPYRHVGSLAALDANELAELATLTQRAEVAITEAYRPQGINVGINLGTSAGAGILEHLHVHAVPRWTGDTNFMTVVGNMRVLPEDLAVSADRLRPIFERLAR